MFYFHYLISTLNSTFCLGKRKGNGGADSGVQSKIIKGSRDIGKTPLDVFNEFQPVSFFLTKVHDIPSRFNTTGAMSLKGEIIVALCEKAKL